MKISFVLVFRWILFRENSHFSQSFGGRTPPLCAFQKKPPFISFCRSKQFNSNRAILSNSVHARSDRSWTTLLITTTADPSSLERKYQAIATNGATYPRLFRLPPIKACQTKKSTRPADCDWKHSSFRQLIGSFKGTFKTNVRFWTRGIFSRKANFLETGKNVKFETHERKCVSTAESFPWSMLRTLCSWPSKRTCNRFTLFTGESSGA